MKPNRNAAVELSTAATSSLSMHTENEKYQTKPNNLMNTTAFHFGFEENTTLDYEGTTG